MKNDYLFTLNKFRVINWGIIYDVLFELDGKNALFLGGNGSGKSTLYDAVAYFTFGVISEGRKIIDYVLARNDNGKAKNTDDDDLKEYGKRPVGTCSVLAGEYVKNQGTSYARYRTRIMMITSKSNSAYDVDWIEYEGTLDKALLIKNDEVLTIREISEYLKSEEKILNQILQNQKVRDAQAKEYGLNSTYSKDRYKKNFRFDKMALDGKQLNQMLTSLFPEPELKFSSMLDTIEKIEKRKLELKNEEKISEASKKTIDSIDEWNRMIEKQEESKKQLVNLDYSEAKYIIDDRKKQIDILQANIRDNTNKMTENSTLIVQKLKTLEALEQGLNPLNSYKIELENYKKKRNVYSNEQKKFIEEINFLNQNLKIVGADYKYFIDVLNVPNIEFTNECMNRISPIMRKLYEHSENMEIDYNSQLKVYDNKKKELIHWIKELRDNISSYMENQNNLKRYFSKENNFKQALDKYFETKNEKVELHFLYQTLEIIDEKWTNVVETIFGRLRFALVVPKNKFKEVSDFLKSWNEDNTNIFLITQEKYVDVVSNSLNEVVKCNNIIAENFVKGYLNSRLMFTYEEMCEKAAEGDLPRGAVSVDGWFNQPAYHKKAFVKPMVIGEDATKRQYEQDQKDADQAEKEFENIKEKIRVIEEKISVIKDVKEFFVDYWIKNLNSIKEAVVEMPKTMISIKDVKRKIEDWKNENSNLLKQIDEKDEIEEEIKRLKALNETLNKNNSRNDGRIEGFESDINNSEGKISFLCEKYPEEVLKIVEVKDNNFKYEKNRLKHLIDNDYQVDINRRWNRVQTQLMNLNSLVSVSGKIFTEKDYDLIKDLVIDSIEKVQNYQKEISLSQNDLASLFQKNVYDEMLDKKIDALNKRKIFNDMLENLEFANGEKYKLEIKQKEYDPFACKVEYYISSLLRRETVKTDIESNNDDKSEILAIVLEIIKNREKESDYLDKIFDYRNYFVFDMQILMKDGWHWASNLKNASSGENKRRFFALWTLALSKDADARNRETSLILMCDEMKSLFDSSTYQIIIDYIESIANVQFLLFMQDVQNHPKPQIQYILVSDVMNEIVYTRAYKYDISEILRDE